MEKSPIQSIFGCLNCTLNNVGYCKKINQRKSLTLYGQNDYFNLEFHITIKILSHLPIVS